MIITESPDQRRTRLLWEDIADARNGRGDHRVIYRRNALAKIADYKRRKEAAWAEIKRLSAINQVRRVKEAAE